jgi:hypothetical protein
MVLRKNTMIGYYSAEAAEKFGSAYYKDSNGAEHEITYVTETGVYNYNWNDAVLVSEDLVSYSRKGSEGYYSKDGVFSNDDYDWITEGERYEDFLGEHAEEPYFEE